jgi:hypothetical protein
VELFKDYFGTNNLSYLFDPLHPALLRPDHLYALKAFDLQEETDIIQEFNNSTFVFKPGSQQQKLFPFNLSLESVFLFSRLNHEIFLSVRNFITFF